jgi:sigma-B regulation protein RsbU (phosphoserine phosphatase)
MFVTLFYASVDLDSGQMSYISAGHHAPFLMRNSAVCELEMQSSAALGLIEDSEYTVNHFTLQAGDKLFTYTDGLDETFDPQGAMFDLSGIRTLLENNQHASVQQIGEQAFSQALAFSDGQAQFDDTTVLALTFKPSKAFLLNDITVMQSRQFYLRNQLDSLENFFAQLRDVAESFAMTANTLSECQLIGEEILANAINYGGAAMDSELQWAIAKTENGYLLQFIDQGLAFNPLMEATEPVLGLPAEDTDIGGLGVHLIKALTKEQAYQRKDSYNQLCVYIETAE